MNHGTRKPLYEQIEQDRGTRVLAFVTGERGGLETGIAGDAVAPFVALLDDMGPVPKLSLILDTNGGHTSAAWRLINLLRSFCEDLEVIIPTKAMSAGTLMALGANKIIMTKQAALGPIDPSLSNDPLGPKVLNASNQPVSIPVSAEAIRGYLDEVKKSVKDSAGMATVWNQLSTQIHPLVLGQVFRLGGQIRALAGDLIKVQVANPKAQKQIIQHLCSDSGSHDYTINRRRAVEMGLNVAKPTSAEYSVLRDITKSYNSELKTFEPYSPQGLLAGQQSQAYTLVRGLIESTDSSYGYVSDGIVADTGQPPPGNIVDQRTFEGWRKLP
jgi:hypothetical protein